MFGGLRLANFPWPITQVRRDWPQDLVHLRRHLRRHLSNALLPLLLVRHCWLPLHTVLWGVSRLAGHPRPLHLGMMVAVAVALSRLLRLAGHLRPSICAGRWQMFLPRLFYRRFPLRWMIRPLSLFYHRFPLLWWMFPLRLCYCEFPLW